MSGSKPADTAMTLNDKLWEKGDTRVDTGSYHRLAGKHIYFSHTISNIAFFSSVVSQFMHVLFEEHLEVVRRILSCLKAIPRKGLYFKKINDKNVEISTDANWVGYIIDRKSTSSY
jgi:hypothetical protein